MAFLDRTVFDATTAAMTVSSDPIPLDQYTRLTIVATLAGSSSPNATLKLQVSNDPPTGTAQSVYTSTPTNWADVPSASVQFTADASRTLALEWCGRWARLVWTVATNGGGTISAIAHATVTN